MKLQRFEHNLIHVLHITMLGISTSTALLGPYQGGTATEEITKYIQSYIHLFVFVLGRFFVSPYRPLLLEAFARSVLAYYCGVWLIPSIVRAMYILRLDESTFPF